ETTSASARRGQSSAWPVPRATTLTTMPVFCLNSGRMKPYNPESCVEVVDATTMDLSCAEASDICARAKAITNARVRIGEPSLSGPVGIFAVESCQVQASNIYGSVPPVIAAVSDFSVPPFSGTHLRSRLDQKCEAILLE